MTIEAEIFPIRLRRPFRIAHGVSFTRQTVLVRIRDGVWTGHGEGALPPYYPSTADASLAWAAARNPECPLPSAPQDAAAGRVAVEMALEELTALRAGLPLARTWGLDPAFAPPCPTTLSIPGSPRELEEELDEALAAGAVRLKLKSGSGDPAWDLECARRISRTGLPFSLDVNGGWDPPTAADRVCRVGDLGAEFVEEPVPRDLAAWRRLRELATSRAVPPLVADESHRSPSDLADLAGVADGVNIKILKAGGLQAARREIAEARRLGLRVMVGVMVETGIGRTAAAHLAPSADWLDIDPPSSIPAAPLCGFTVERGRLLLSGGPGLGLEAVGAPDAPGQPETNR